ncbi:MAG: hypothetical protein ACR2KX_14725 [Chitinophagaceae bacterium]
MEKLFLTFYETIIDDPRIGASHISIYMTLLYLHKNKNPFEISRDVVMKCAKISARQTYNKCINDLQAFGYIKYSPASNAFEESVVWLI